MFQRCLVCTDFSDGLHRLINFVPSLAANGIKQIVFLYSLPLREDGQIPREDTKRINQVHEKLSVALQQVSPGVEVKVEVRSGRSLFHQIICVVYWSGRFLVLLVRYCGEFGIQFYFFPSPAKVKF